MSAENPELHRYEITHIQNRLTLLLGIAIENVNVEHTSGFTVGSNEVNLYTAKFDLNLSHLAEPRLNQRLVEAASNPQIANYFATIQSACRIIVENRAKYFSNEGQPSLLAILQDLKRAKNSNLSDEFLLDTLLDLSPNRAIKLNPVILRNIGIGKVPVSMKFVYKEYSNTTLDQGIAVAKREIDNYRILYEHDFPTLCALQSDESNSVITLYDPRLMSHNDVNIFDSDTKIIEKVFQTIGKLNKLGYVHGDGNPGNILFRQLVQPGHIAVIIDPARMAKINQGNAQIYLNAETLILGNFIRGAYDIAINNNYANTVTKSEVTTYINQYISSLHSTYTGIDTSQLGLNLNI